MKADWKDPRSAPLCVRLMVSSLGCYIGEPGLVGTATRVEGSVWVDDRKRIVDRPYGWDFLPESITLTGVRELREGPRVTDYSGADAEGP